MAAGVPTIWMQVLPALEGPGHVEPAGDPVRRLGRAQGAVGGLPRAARAADPPGVGDDRDQPGRVGVPPRRRPGAAARSTSRPTCGPASAGPRSASSAASSSPDTHAPRAPRRGVERRAAVPRDLDRRRRYYNDPRARRELHRRRLAAHRRRRHDGRAGPDPARRPDQGPHQVGRRVDLVGRAGERADGPPADQGGRRHRRARPEVVRAAAGLRRPRARRRADASRTCSTSSPRQVAKWQLPDDVVFIDEVPKTSVGKFSKKTLRERFADHVTAPG